MPVSERLITNLACASAVRKSSWRSIPTTIERMNEKTHRPPSATGLGWLGQHHGGCPEIATNGRKSMIVTNQPWRSTVTEDACPRPPCRCRPMPARDPSHGSARGAGRRSANHRRHAQGAGDSRPAGRRSIVRARRTRGTSGGQSRMTRLPGAPSVGRCPCCGTDSGAWLRVDRAIAALERHGVWACGQRSRTWVAEEAAICGCRPITFVVHSLPGSRCATVRTSTTGGRPGQSRWSERWPSCSIALRTPGGRGRHRRRRRRRPGAASTWTHSTRPPTAG